MAKRQRKDQVRIVIRRSFGRISAEVETSNDGGKTWDLSSSHATYAETSTRGKTVSMDVLSILDLECVTFDRQFVGVLIEKEVK